VKMLCKDYGIIMHSGHDFIDHGDNHLRINLGTSNENVKYLIKSIEEVTKKWNK
jgi:bifunctional pyridoxal-dependent enzyme with beta-cystathionase and maltose regulon repressor activities